MITKLSNDRRSFLADELFKSVILWIAVARHSKILPYHNSVSVAEIKEFVVLVDVSAPTAKNITAYILYQRESLVVSLCVAAVECVKRHPVSALAEYLNTVYKKAEIALFALRRALTLEFYITDSE